MLDINIEFRKGVLFVRLEGILNRETTHILNREVLDIIKINGIKYMVLNLENLYYIDLSGIDALIKHYEIIKSHNGKASICGINTNIVKNRIKDSEVLDCFYEIPNELSALKIMSL